MDENTNDNKGTGIWSSSSAGFTSGPIGFATPPRSGFTVTAEFLQTVHRVLSGKSPVVWLSTPSGDSISPYDWDDALAAGVRLSQRPETPVMLMYGDDVLMALFHQGIMFIPGELIKG